MKIFNKDTGFLRIFCAHCVLLSYSAVAVLPIVMIIINSFKSKKYIFKEPSALPNGDSVTVEGYFTVFEISNLGLYLFNSLSVTLIAVGGVLLFGAMAAFAMSEYRFKGNKLIAFLLVIGLVIPIRLGTVAILDFMAAMALTNTLTALILVYIAQGIPLAVFIFYDFITKLPDDVKDAARIDNVSEISIFFILVLPMIRPVCATVALFSMLPIWNDLWFPLILAPVEEVKTLTLGTQGFIAQFQTDWAVLFSALSMAVFPVLGVYLFFSRFVIRGITSGTVD